MALEDLTGTNKFISNLVASNPTPTDGVVQGDDHIRGIKQVLLNSFPFITGANKGGLSGQPLSTILVIPTTQNVTAVNPATGNFNTAPIVYTPKTAPSRVHVFLFGQFLLNTIAGGNACAMSISGPGVTGTSITIGLSSMAAGADLRSALCVPAIIDIATLAPVNIDIVGTLYAGGTGIITAWMVFVECST